MSKQSIAEVVANLRKALSASSEEQVETASMVLEETYCEDIRAFILDPVPKVWADQIRNMGEGQPIGIMFKTFFEESSDEDIVAGIEDEADPATLLAALDNFRIDIEGGFTNPQK